MILCQITDQLLRSFSRALSLPQICMNFEKAAYDPRVAGIYLHIDNLKCGWGKLDEIRRQVLDFKKSGTYLNTSFVNVSNTFHAYLLEMWMWKSPIWLSLHFLFS